MRWYGPQPVGKSVLKNADGSYTAKFNPTIDECAAAEIVYLGGHVYEVDSDEATDLTNAGYGAYLS